MRDVFVETSNYRAFTAAMSQLDARGAAEASIIVLDGQPGLGKTTTLARWATQTGRLYVCAQVGWDYTWLMSTLLTELSISPPRGRLARFEALIGALSDRIAAADILQQPYGLVVDECDRVSARGEIMETIRGISDIRNLPIILVGMGKLRDNLRRFPQIESRAPRKVTFLPATLEDCKALISGKCEVPVAPCLTAFVHRVSRGFNREIMDAIANIERFGQRSEIGPEGVTLADMAGQPLLNDRTTGRMIDVPRAA